MDVSRNSSSALLGVILFLTAWYGFPYLVLSFIFMDLLWPVSQLGSVVARVGVTVPFLFWTAFAGCVIHESFVK